MCRTDKPNPPAAHCEERSNLCNRQSLKYHVWLSGARLIGHPEILVLGFARVEIASFLAMSVVGGFPARPGARLIGHPEILVLGFARVEIASFLEMSVVGGFPARPGAQLIGHLEILVRD